MRVSNYICDYFYKQKKPNLNFKNGFSKDAFPTKFQHITLARRRPDLKNFLFENMRSKKEF